RADPPFAHQLTHPADVHRAPDPRRLPRREAYRVALLVDALPHPVDPPDAERLVHRLRPGDALPPLALLVESHPQLAGAVVVLGEPGPELRGRGEEARLHGEPLHRRSAEGVPGDGASLRAG